MSPRKNFSFLVARDSSLEPRGTGDETRTPGYAQNGRSAINLARLIALLTLR
jgi:hypothetical protein